ncbi:MAG: hypothetical protein ACE5F6_01215 [Anaerolineae bacterium]
MIRSTTDRPVLPHYAFSTTWILTTVGLGWLVLQGHHDFESRVTVPALVAMLVCTATLMWWLPAPSPMEQPATTPTRRGCFALAVVGLAGILFGLVALAGRALLVAFPVAAVVALAVLRQRPSRQEVLYSLGLALVAGIAGLGAGWITVDVPPTLWAGLQVALVLTGLLAGWAILRHVGLLEIGVGRSLFLTEGTVAALRSFGRGMLIGIPWALLLVALGGSNNDTWVRLWWQPLVAIQPGIAEEVWGRVFLISLLFLALRRVGRTRLALTGAVVVAGYWFAYLHTDRGLSLNTVFSTLMMGTLYSLPLSYIWLRSGLETAVGFHFWQDFVRFVAAFLLNQSSWL